MPIISLIKLFLTLASTFAKYAADKQLLEAGENKAILEGIQNANDAIARASIARYNASKLPVSEDPNNRDAK